MENDVLSSILVDEPTETNNVADDEQEDTVDHTFDLTDDDLEDEENSETNDTAESDEAEDAEEDNSKETIQNPTNAAFAQMRTQNKEYQNKLGQIDTLAKSLGLKDVDDLIAKAKEAQVKQEAANKGIPIEVARELEEMRALKESIVAEREKTAAADRQRVFVSNLQDFVDKNKLSKAAVDKLSQDLENDGFQLDTLMAMPWKAASKVLSSYVDTKYQQALERKNTIRKELPINQNTKIDTQSLNKEIDALAKHLAGKD